MAAVTNLPGKGNYRPVWIWDITEPVGPGRWNRRPDVMLVQFALNQLIRPMNMRDNRKPFNNGPDDPMLGRVHGYPLLSFLEVDGYFGKESAYTLGLFQKGSAGAKDGVVDPVYPLMKDDPEDDHHYKIIMRTIFSLNEKIVQTYGKMMDEARFPPLLQADIKAHGS